MGIDFSFFHEYSKNGKWYKHSYQLDSDYRGSVLDSAMSLHNIGKDWCEFDIEGCSPSTAKEIKIYTDWFYILSRDNVSSIIDEIRKEGKDNWDRMADVLQGLLNNMKDNSRVIVHGM